MIVVGHSPNFQTMLHIIVSASIMASLPAFINSDGMLSIPAAFPLFIDLTVASTSSRSTGKWFYMSFLREVVNYLECSCVVVLVGVIFYFATLFFNPVFHGSLHATLYCVVNL